MLIVNTFLEGGKWLFLVFPKHCSLWEPMTLLSVKNLGSSTGTCSLGMHQYKLNRGQMEVTYCVLMEPLKESWGFLVHTLRNIALGKW